MNDDLLLDKCEFKIGDKFVYLSKYGGVAFGIIENILPVRSFHDGLFVYVYKINYKYDSKEIYHYEDAGFSQEQLTKAIKFMELKKN